MLSIWRYLIAFISFKNVKLQIYSMPKKRERRRKGREFFYTWCTWLRGRKKSFHSDIIREEIIYIENTGWTPIMWYIEKKNFNFWKKAFSLSFTLFLSPTTKITLHQYEHNLQTKKKNCLKSLGGNLHTTLKIISSKVFPFLQKFPLGLKIKTKIIITHKLKL